MKNFSTNQVKNIKSNNRLVKLSQDNEDEADELQFRSNKLGYFRSTQQAECLDIHITGYIQDASYYTQVVQAIKQTEEGDVIKLHINSYGGNLNGLQSLLSAMFSTEATTVAYLDGACFSAASMLALHCDNIHVSPMSEAMVHFVSFSTGGKGSDVLGHVEFIQRTSEKLFRDTYEYFLTAEEIEQCIHSGKEIWLDSEQIIERLQNKYSTLQAERESESDEECQGDCEGCNCYAEPEVKQTKTSRKKTTN